jgi:hypothetical protein
MRWLVEFVKKENNYFKLQAKKCTIKHKNAESQLFERVRD